MTFKSILFNKMEWTATLGLVDVNLITDAGLVDLNLARYFAGVVIVVDDVHGVGVEAGKEDVGRVHSVDPGQIEPIEVRRLKGLAPHAPAAVDPDAVDPLSDLGSAQMTHDVRKVMENVDVGVLSHLIGRHRPARRVAGRLFSYLTSTFVNILLFKKVNI